MTSGTVVTKTVEPTESGVNKGLRVFGPLRRSENALAPFCPFNPFTRGALGASAGRIRRGRLGA